MSKEYGEYGVPGHESTKRNIRQTLNGVRGLAGNNPIADVLEFRKEYTVVSVSQRNGRTGKRASEPATTHEPETKRPAPGLRSAWSRDAEPRVRVQYGRQSGELEVGSWPERIAPGRTASDTAAVTPSMKDTIRAARAFFGSDPADATVVAPPPADDDTTAGAQAPADPEPESKAAQETAEARDGNAEPTAEAREAATARIHKLSALSMRIGGGKPAAVDPSAQVQDEQTETAGETDGEATTEALMAEIACDIVEDALVSCEDSPDAEFEAGDEDTEPQDPEGDRPRLFIDEADDQPTGEKSKDTVLLFDDVENVVVEVAPDDEAAQEDDEDGEADAEVTAITVPLRRDRRLAPRLPSTGSAPRDADNAIEDVLRAERIRAPGSPKWSASARHHMSDMLATSEREVPPIRGRSGTELPRIDLRADRHRRSSAMILLGLPAMLMFGFGAAYVYHASSYDPARVFEQAREAIPASIAAIPGLVADPPKPKISESIIQKQEAAVAPTKVAAAPSEPLPPPVAPPVEPAVAPATVQAAPATAEVEPAAPQAPPVAKAEPVTKVPDRLPEPARIEPAAAAVTSALMIAPAEGNVAELPKPLTPQPLPGEDGEETNETTVSALPAPAAKEAAPVQVKAAAANTKVAALTPASQPVGEEAGEVGQLIARGNERMEIGDIAAARLLFELAAESGSPVAATAMGRSYDPVHFIRVGVRGVKPDADKAREWYQKAVSGGYKAAEDDLRNLTAWLTTQ